MTHQVEVIAAEGTARHRILDTAETLFYQRGIRAVGIDEIVARSGVAKATLYAHFGSKDRLVAAYLQRRSDAWQAFLEFDLDAQAGGPAVRLNRIFHWIELGCLDPSFRGCPFINFVVEFPDRSAPGWDVCLTHRDWLRNLISDIARAGNAADPGLLAEQLCLLYDAAMVGGMFDRPDQCATTVRVTANHLIRTALPTER